MTIDFQWIDNRHEIIFRYIYRERDTASKLAFIFEKYQDILIFSPTSFISNIEKH